MIPSGFPRYQFRCTIEASGLKKISLLQKTFNAENAERNDFTQPLENIKRQNLQLCVVPFCIEVARSYRRKFT